MEATTRRLASILQIKAKAKISALLSDLEMKAYLINEQNSVIASSLQSTSLNDLTYMTSIVSYTPAKGSTLLGGNQKWSILCISTTKPAKTLAAFNRHRTIM